LLRRIVIFSLLGLITQALWADEPSLRVATRIVEPFVYQDNGQLTGFSVDLWQEIAQRLKLTSKFVVVPDINGLLSNVQSGAADLGIAAISITAERERTVDFSQPMFDSGLQIMVATRAHRSDVITAVIEGIFSSTLIPLLEAVALLILVPAHLVWFWERRHPASMLSHRSYFPGIFEACWWAASTLATQADQMPRATFARIIAVMWMFASVIFVAYFTATVTSNLTVQQMHGVIEGPADLPGKRVYGLSGSTSLDYLHVHSVSAQVVKTLDEAVDGLLNREGDAIVYDAPALMYYAAHEGKGKVNVVGAMFHRENYGIVFPEHSARLKAIDGALLKMKEDGTYDQLYAKWFEVK